MVSQQSAMLGGLEGSPLLLVCAPPETSVRVRDEKKAPCVHVPVPAPVCVHVLVCAHASECVQVCMCVHVHMHVSVCACMYMCLTFLRLGLKFPTLYFSTEVNCKVMSYLLLKRKKL